MFDSLFGLFGGKSKSSYEIARDRLKVVLVHDRASISPEVMERMREEILQVISKYMDVDRKSMDIGLETQDDAVAVVANIPIRNYKHLGNRRN